MNQNSSNVGNKQPTESSPVADIDNAKLINTITEFIPTFFSSAGTIPIENTSKKTTNVLETLIQSENFFEDHPKSFQADETKNTYVVNRLHGLARIWGLSLLVDGTLSSLKYEEFKHLLLTNFDSANDRKQKYVLMKQLWDLKQNQLGKVAEYTIEFGKLASRLGWPDDVLIGIIGKGLLDKVRDEFDKEDKPKSVFEATNLVIKIDKNCFIESCIKNNVNNDSNQKSKTFNRKKYEFNKSESKQKFLK